MQGRIVFCQCCRHRSVCCRGVRSRILQSAIIHLGQSPSEEMTKNLPSLHQIHQHREVGVTWCGSLLTCENPAARTSPHPPAHTCTRPPACLLVPCVCLQAPTRSPTFQQLIWCFELAWQLVWNGLKRVWFLIGSMLLLQLDCAEPYASLSQDRFQAPFHPPHNKEAESSN